MNEHMTKNKTALITAASGGIGRSIALKLAREGYHIGVHYHSNREEALRIKKEAESFGVRAELFQGDAEEPERMAAMARDFTACFGRIDVLVNNAGITVLRPLLVALCVLLVVAGVVMGGWNWVNRSFLAPVDAADQLSILHPCRPRSIFRTPACMARSRRLW